MVGPHRVRKPAGVSGAIASSPLTASIGQSSPFQILKKFLGSCVLVGSFFTFYECLSAVEPMKCLADNNSDGIKEDGDIDQPGFCL